MGWRVAARGFPCVLLCFCRSAFQSVLWRLLEEFCRQYPGIVPDVQLEDRVG